MATKKRLFLWGRAFRRVSQLSALFAQHCARCAYEGEHGGSYDGNIAGLRCSQTIVPAYAEGSPVVLAGYAVAVAGAYVAAAPVTAGVVVVAGVIVPVGTAAVIRPRVGISLVVKPHGRGICIVAAVIYAASCRSYRTSNYRIFFFAVSLALECRGSAAHAAPVPSRITIVVTKGGNINIFLLGFASGASIRCFSRVRTRRLLWISYIFRHGMTKRRNYNIINRIFTLFILEITLAKRAFIILNISSFRAGSRLAINFV